MTFGYNSVLDARFGSRQRAFSLPVVAFDHIESIYDDVRWRMLLEHPQWDFWSEFADGAKQEFREFDYRFGMTVSSPSGGNDQISDWYRGMVLKSNQVVTPHGSRVRIVGSGASLSMKSRTRVQGWVGSFDAIAQKIALDHGLAIEVEASDNETEDAANGGFVTHWQYGENDWEFIRRVSKDLTSSRRARGSERGSGRGDYEVWVTRGTTLNVRPPGNDNQSRQVWGTGDLGASLKGIRLVQRKRALQMGGGLSVQAIGFDTLTKQLITTTKNYSNFLENTRLAPRVTLPENNLVPALTFRSSTQDENRLERLATARLGERFRHMYLVEAEVFPVFTGYDVGDIITFRLTRPDGSTDNIFTGNYILEQRWTRIRKRRVTMHLLASRIGSVSGDEVLRGLDMTTPAVERAGGRFRRVERI